VEFWLPGSSNQLNHKTFAATNDDWGSLMEQVQQWAEQHLYPHQIAYFSVYEDEHSMENADIRATLYFRGEANAKLSLPEGVSGPIYKVEHHVQGGDWEESYQWGSDRLAALGLRQSRAIPASANKEEGNEKVMCIISWSRDVENSLNTRNGGCCTIF